MDERRFQGLGEKEISLAMLGMVDGNGHPYSWSAIFNGYDPDEMAKCPYPVIAEYLGKEPKETLRVPNARVTHIWTDDPEDAKRVAKASLIPKIVERPEDVVGAVDAVVIATDKGHEHVDRCRPFIEAGLPIFVDKPLVDNAQDLATFRKWHDEGKPFLSSSCMRYAKEFMPYRISTNELGRLRFASVTTPKSWERYGIHALEAIYPILGPGFISCRNTGDRDRNIVHFKHRSGADVVVVATSDMYGAFGALQLCGTAGAVQTKFQDTFYAFKTQLEGFVSYLRTGVPPFPFAETVELMGMVIAGVRSREERGREVSLEEI
ncbi:MAG TPA: Gfo/Idh/MocA family oxidoreductase [Sumerlaeia bacterium]|nr:Gfo/Idh/MocA family oxidoreductase [Sumerlaeia bacterium]